MRERSGKIGAQGLFRTKLGLADRVTWATYTVQLKIWTAVVCRYDCQKFGPLPKFYVKEDGEERLMWHATP